MYLMFVFLRQKKRSPVRLVPIFSILDQDLNRVGIEQHFLTAAERDEISKETDLSAWMLEKQGYWRFESRYKRAFY